MSLYEKDCMYVNPKLNMFMEHKTFNICSGAEKNWKQSPVC